MTCGSKPDGTVLRIGTRGTGSTKGIMVSANRGFRNLIVWKRMQELVLLTYELSAKLPSIEKYGLMSQMQRAVVSVLSNFVEGYIKSSKKEKRVYMERSVTSLLELDAQMEVCLVLKYITDNDFSRFEQKKSEVGYLLYRYKSKIY